MLLNSGELHHNAFLNLLDLSDGWPIAGLDRLAVHLRLPKPFISLLEEVYLNHTCVFLLLSGHRATIDLSLPSNFTVFYNDSKKNLMHAFVTYDGYLCCVFFSPQVINICHAHLKFRLSNNNFI